MGGGGGGAQVEPLAGILPDIFVFCVLPGLLSILFLPSSTLLGLLWNHILCCALSLFSLCYVSRCLLPPPIAA